MSSARYGGAWPDKDEKTKLAIVCSQRVSELAAAKPARYGEVYSIR